MTIMKVFVVFEIENVFEPHMVGVFATKTAAEREIQNLMVEEGLSDIDFTIKEEEVR